MNSREIGKLTIFAIIILIVIFIVTITILLQLKIPKEQNVGKTEEEIGEDFTQSYGKAENGGIDRQAYCDIKMCMKKYLNTINIRSLQYGTYNQNGEYIQTMQESEIKEKIYNLLSEKYISEKNITVTNVHEHIKVLQESAVFVPIDVALVQDAEIKSFILYGLIESSQDFRILDKMYAVLNINFNKNEFSIEPIYENYNNISEIKIKKYEDTILSKGNNRFNFEYISAQETPEEYMELYKRLALGCPEKVYELLDDEYKKLKFESLEKFKAYIEKNKEKIKKAVISKYQVNTKNNEVAYICLDQNENYYIFKENDDFLNYTLILDAYTIDLPEFIETYNKADDEKKAGMNVAKIFSAIKDEDYKYIYNKLDNTFKSNKFPTEKDLENYIKSNLSNTLDIEHIKSSQEGNICIYKTKIGEKYFNFIIQLGTGTDFVMSFSVE